MSKGNPCTDRFSEQLYVGQKNKNFLLLLSQVFQFLGYNISTERSRTTLESFTMSGLKCTQVCKDSHETL